MRQSAERAIAAKIQQIGQQIHDGQYQAVYEQASQELRSRFTHDLVIRQLGGFNAVPQVGKLEYLRWNEEPMAFEVNPDTGGTRVTAMTLEKLEKISEPGRELIVFVKEGDNWTLLDIPRVIGEAAPKPPPRQ